MLKEERTFIVHGAESGELLAQIPIKSLRVSPRLGRLTRRFEFPDGARFETFDNDGADALLRAGRRPRRGNLIDRLESSFKWVGVAFVAALLSVYLFVTYGIPAAALSLAEATPRSVSVLISDQTLAAMDRVALSPTHLRLADQNRARALFFKISKQGKMGVSAYRVLFRDGGRIGPNAFSLPDGRVILTDQLYGMVKSDDELEGVFGHEIAHADRRHALQSVYQASLVPAAIALMTGDVTQAGQMATILPGILLQSAYSRGMEQQADDDSAAMMRRIGGDPAALGNLLVRMESKICGRTGCMPSWLGDHPETAMRASRLRSERAAPR